MNWDDLRYFLAVARSGSLSAASRRLTDSPATISRRLEQLETALGHSLFQRQSRGLILTGSGQRLLERAETAEAAILALERAAAGEREDTGGLVRLATAEALASHLIAPALPALRAQHPALLLALRTEVRTVSLARREADIALRLIRPDQGDYRRQKVGTLGFGLYCASSLPLPAEPWGMAFIGWDEAYQDIPAASWVKEPALSRLAVTATSMLSQLALAEAGMGSVILPCLVANASPHLRCLLGPPDVGSLDLWLVTHRDLDRAPAIRAVRDFLASLCRDHAKRLRGEECAPSFHI
jgi:DNA-binding transcriptional LysR family regulator